MRYEKIAQVGESVIIAVIPEKIREFARIVFWIIFNPSKYRVNVQVDKKWFYHNTK